MKKAIILLSFLLIFVFCKSQAWEVLNTIPATGAIHDIFMFDSLNGWAVGNNGLVLHTEDAGEIWTRQTTNTHRLLHQVSFCDEQNGWIATTASRVLKTNDGGENWEIIDVPGNQFDYTAICCLSPDTIIVAGTYNRVSKTTDGGETWITQSLSRVSIHWPSKIVFTSPDKGYIFGGDVFGDIGHIFITQDKGDSWLLQDTGFDLKYITDASFIDPDTGILSTADTPLVYRTFDGGENWNKIILNNPFTYNGFRSISLHEGGLGYGLATQTIMKTEDYGDTWDTTFITSLYLPTRTCMEFFSSEKGFISGSSGAILKTVDSGDHFVNTIDGFFNGISAITFNNENEGWICGSSLKNVYPLKGMVGRTQDGGVNWDIIDPAANGQLRDIEFHNSSIGWTCGKDGILLKTEDGGVNWRVINIPTSLVLYQVENFDNMVWMSGTQGQIFYSDDWGENWELQYQSADYILNNLEFFDNGIGYTWGYNTDDDSPILIRTNDFGKTWNDCSVETVGRIRKLLPLEYKEMLLLNYDYELFTSDDLGMTWTYLQTAPFDAYEINVMTPDIWWIAGQHSVAFSMNQGEDWEISTFYYPDITRMISFPEGDQWLQAGPNLLYRYFDITGIDNNNHTVNHNELSIFPNPFSELATIEYDLVQTSEVTIVIFNHHGEMIEKKHFQQPSGKQQFTWNSEGLPAGLYFFTLKAGEQIVTGKMMLVW